MVTPFPTGKQPTATASSCKNAANVIIVLLILALLQVYNNNELAIASAVKEAHLRCHPDRKILSGEESGYDNVGSKHECCVQCTTPRKQCCLVCSDVAPLREHDLLMASMEGLTHHVMETFQSGTHTAEVKQSHGFLKDRAWEGNSHIGNRPAQATFYYDWVRSIQRTDNVHRVCEIGMNGGHSAVIFLAGLHASQKNSGIHLTMFDLSAFEYSKTVEKYINVLYPGMFTLHAGNSRVTLPKWTEEYAKNGVYCDVFSVDGDHTYEGALIDITNAAKATRKGGNLILDDMNPNGVTRKAFDEVVRDGILGDVRCVEDVEIRVGYDNRIDETNARELKISWCTATVL
jgi:hypothetical protein